MQSICWPEYSISAKMFGSYSEKVRAAEDFEGETLDMDPTNQRETAKTKTGEQTSQCCRHPSRESVGCPGKGGDPPETTRKNLVILGMFGAGA